MSRIISKSKIHQAKVTETNLEYEGSLTLDRSLMKAADMIPYEQIHVYNLSNGERFITYLIEGQENSGVVAVNGAAAHKAKGGDKLIIASYAVLEEEKIDYFLPKILIVDEKNKIKVIR